MIYLSLNELKLIAQFRNISEYENKSKEYLVKALRDPKSEPKPKTIINKRRSEKVFTN